MATNFTHRSYRIEQRAQYGFEALCHIKGNLPSQAIVSLINEWVEAHIKADPALDDTLTAIVDRRISQVDRLIATGVTPNAGE